jgi:hypothetical protein
LTVCGYLTGRETDGGGGTGVELNLPPPILVLPYPTLLTLLGISIRQQALGNQVLTSVCVACPVLLTWW